MNENNTQNQLPPHIQQQFDEEIRMEVIRQQTEQELRLNPAYHLFFMNYNERSIEAFIRNYARKKATYITKGPSYIKVEEQEQLKYKVLAEEALWAIQQKKLFNLQCQWRAEQVRLKGIEHCAQFQLLSANIQFCPYINLISRAEVNLYIEYLQSGQVGELFWMENWQDYETFKADYISQQNEQEHEPLADRVPTWYSFYDMHMGTAVLMGLPDTRGEKEYRYRSAFRKKRTDLQKQNETLTEGDYRPFLNAYDTDIIEHFIKEFEDTKLLKYFRVVESVVSKFNETTEVDDAIAILKDTDEPIPINGSEDWRESIILAARRFELDQIAKMLPVVFEEYQFRNENNINYDQSETCKKKAEHAFEMCEIAKTQIKNGREILGEKGDLNF